MISDEGDLHVPLDDDTYLMKFLRPARFNPDNAFKVMRRFYRFKVKYPKYGTNITPHAIRHVFDNEVFWFIPSRTPSGARIMAINSGCKYDYQETTTIRKIFCLKNLRSYIV